MPDNRERLIVALDVSSATDAQRIVTTVGESASIFKVGGQLFTAEGPEVVRDLVASGKRVFLDLKFHDIPTTVSRAVGEAAKLGVSMLTVHAAGGVRMLQGAVQAANAGPNRPLVLAVTVLTSLSDDDLQQTGVSGRVLDQVLRLAGLARTTGCQGMVAAAAESREIRRELGSGFILVNPGVRPAGSAKDDQARIVTPEEAIAAGADYVVVGRPITQAADPGAAAREIVQALS